MFPLYTEVSLASDLAEPGFRRGDMVRLPTEIAVSRLPRSR
jgi:hypothetical protein